MRKLRLVAVVSLAALSIPLAACSSGTSDAGGKQTLTVEDYFTDTGKVYDAIYKECGTQIGATIKSNHVAGAALISKVLQQASSKTLPDVLMLDNPDVQQIADSGALAPLKSVGVSAPKDYVSAVIKAGTYKGDLYGLAPAINSIGLYYNVDMLKAAGVTPPTTWPELKAAASKLTDKANGVYGFAMSNINTYEGTWQFLPFFWTAGGNEKNIDTPDAAKALQFIVDLQNDGSMSKSALNWSQADVNNQFLAGKAAMMVNGPWQLPALKAKSGLKFASVPIPTPTAGKKVVSPLGGETFNVPRTGDKDKMASAGKFVACLNTPKIQTKMADAVGDVPSSERVAASFAKSHPDIAAFADVVKTARARTAELGPGWPKAATAIYTAVQLALTGKASPTAALQQAQTQAK